MKKSSIILLSNTSLHLCLIYQQTTMWLKPSGTEVIFSVTACSLYVLPRANVWATHFCQLPQLKGSHLNGKHCCALVNRRSLTTMHMYTLTDMPAGTSQPLCWLAAPNSLRLPQRKYQTFHKIPAAHCELEGITLSGCTPVIKACARAGVVFWRIWGQQINRELYSSGSPKQFLCLKIAAALSTWTRGWKTSLYAFKWGERQ